VRPTDENQSPSKRPNLISSQRLRSGEINILAMLDGQTGRPFAQRLSALPPALWYGGAALLACALVGTLLWLARDTAPSPAALAATPVSRLAAEPPALSVAPPLISMPAPVELAQAPRALAPAATRPADPVPPPVMKRHAAPVAHGAGVRPGPPHPATRSTAIAYKAPAAARARHAPVARTHAAPPAVDTDVALISAIIQNGPVREPAGDSCAEPPCGPRFPDHP
jgi:hypothetical protein